jgi:hypothetical protein
MFQYVRLSIRGLGLHRFSEGLKVIQESHTGVVKSLARCYKRPFEYSIHTVKISIKERIQWKKDH